MSLRIRKLYPGDRIYESTHLGRVRLTISTAFEESGVTWQSIRLDCLTIKRDCFLSVAADLSEIPGIEEFVSIGMKRLEHDRLKEVRQ